MGLGGVAHAEVLASGPVFGASRAFGGTITCRIFNAGLTAVNAAQRQIWTNAGVSATPTSDSDNAAVAPNNYCAFSFGLVSNFAYSYRIVTSGAETDVRGLAEVESTSGAIISTIPIAK